MGGVSQAGKTASTSSCAPPVSLRWRRWGRGLCGSRAGLPRWRVCTGSRWQRLSCTGAGRRDTEPQLRRAAGGTGSCLEGQRWGSGWRYWGCSGSGAGSLCPRLLQRLLFLGRVLGLCRWAWGPEPAGRPPSLPPLAGRGCASSCVSWDTSPGVRERGRRREGQPFRGGMFPFLLSRLAGNRSVWVPRYTICCRGHRRTAWRVSRCVWTGAPPGWQRLCNHGYSFGTWRVCLCCAADGETVGREEKSFRFQTETTTMTD